MAKEYLYSCETKEITNAFYDVYNTLGYGFLERVYQNALYKELIRRGLSCSAQHQIDVFYQGEKVGLYFADILVNDQIILELKAAETLNQRHELQLVNYLKATGIEVGLLLNFGVKPEIRRKFFTNERKQISS